MPDRCTDPTCEQHWPARDFKESASLPPPVDAWCPGGGAHTVLPRHKPLTLNGQCMTCDMLRAAIAYDGWSIPVTHSSKDLPDE